AELGEGAVQVAADGAVRQEQPLGDLLVRQADCGQANNFKLLWGELVDDLAARARSAMSRRTNLRSSTFHPWLSSKTPEDLECAAELLSCRHHCPATPQAFAVGQSHSRQVELPAVYPWQLKGGIEKVERLVFRGGHRCASSNHKCEARGQIGQVLLVHRCDVG